MKLSQGKITTSLTLECNNIQYVCEVVSSGKLSSLVCFQIRVKVNKENTSFLMDYLLLPRLTNV